MMTDKQERAFEEQSRGMTPQQKEQLRAELERLLKQQEINSTFNAELTRARNQHAASQQLINGTKVQRYGLIVAIDLRGAISKDGAIPWNYPEDFKWFQQRTTGHICVMGRGTYNDINTRLGEKAATSVLPGRKCFVVTSSPLPRENATAVPSISEVDKHLDGSDTDKIVFFCGGERIYADAFSKANIALITLVNAEVGGDRFFPVEHVLKRFNLEKTFNSPTAPDLRFLVYNRKPT